MSLKPNRFYLNSMKNERLAKFLLDEIEEIKEKYGNTMEGITNWLKEKFDDEYPYKITEMSVDDGIIFAYLSGFTYGDIDVGGVLELYPDDKEHYTLIVTDIIYPMYKGDEFIVKAKFEKSDIIPIDRFSDGKYKGCKVVNTNINIMEVVNV